MIGMVLAQTGDPPGRVVPDGLRLVVGGGDQGIALAQEAAQAGIDEAGLGARGPLLGSFHRLVDQGEWRVRCPGLIPGQGQGRVQQCADARRRVARGQLLLQRLGTAQLAQYLEQQRLDAGAQRLRHARQHAAAGLAFKHGLQALGDGVELLPKRRCGRCLRRRRSAARGRMRALVHVPLSCALLATGSTSRLRTGRKPSSQASSLAGYCAMAAL